MSFLSATSGVSGSGGGAGWEIEARDRGFEGDFFLRGGDPGDSVSKRDAIWGEAVDATADFDDPSTGSSSKASDPRFFDANLMFLRAPSIVIESIESRMASSESQQMLRAERASLEARKGRDWSGLQPGRKRRCSNCILSHLLDPMSQAIGNVSLLSQWGCGADVLFSDCTSLCTSLAHRGCER